MATILVERQLRTYPIAAAATTSTQCPRVYCVVVMDRPRQTPCRVQTSRRAVSDDAMLEVKQNDDGVHLPAVRRHSDDLKTPWYRKQAGSSTMSSKLVDRLTPKEVLSCPELERTTDGGSSSRLPHNLTVRTELLPCVRSSQVQSTQPSYGRRQRQPLARQQQPGGNSSSRLYNFAPATSEPLRAWRKSLTTGDNVDRSLPSNDTADVTCTNNTTTDKTRSPTSSPSLLQRQSQSQVASGLCPANLLKLGSAALGLDNDDQDLDEVFERCETWLLSIAKANQAQQRRS